jgi:pimeloyl-ACP methyl ester carboxylesterase
MSSILHRITVGQNIQIVAEEFGQERAGYPLVLLLHGGGQNRHAWAATARAIHGAGYRVVSCDARGHGDSDWDSGGNYAMDALAHDLLAVRKHFESAQPVFVIGASMGGQTVLCTHRNASPKLWAGIVLVDVTPRPEADGVRRIFDFMSANPQGFGTLQEAADAIAAYNPLRPRSTRLDGLRKVLRQRADGRWAWHWDPSFIIHNVEKMRDPSVWDRHIQEMGDFIFEGARKVTAPILLIRGVMSDVVSDETIAEFLDKVPHAEVANVTNAGHMIAGDNNDVFTREVLAFLNRVTRQCLRAQPQICAD